MNQLTIILLVLPSLCASDLIDKLPGVWTVVAESPPKFDNTVYSCLRRNFEYTNILKKCKCGDTELTLPEFDAIAITFTIIGDDLNTTMSGSKSADPYKEINSLSESRTGLCECESYPTAIAPFGYVRFINENYFVQYVRNRVMLLSAKVVQSEDDLRKMMAADDELRDKIFQIYCDDRMAVNNTDVVHLTSRGAMRFRQFQS